MISILGSFIGNSQRRFPNLVILLLFRFVYFSSEISPNCACCNTYDLPFQHRHWAKNPSSDTAQALLSLTQLLGWRTCRILLPTARPRPLQSSSDDSTSGNDSTSGERLHERSWCSVLRWLPQDRTFPLSHQCSLESWPWASLKVILYFISEAHFTSHVFRSCSQYGIQYIEHSNILLTNYPSSVSLPTPAVVYGSAIEMHISEFGGHFVYLFFIHKI